MKKTIWIRSFVLIGELIVLISLWHIFKKLVYVHVPGFVYIYIFMPLFLLLFLFSCIKTVIILVHLFCRPADIEADTSWRASLPKLAKIGIVVCFLIVSILYGIHLSKFDLNVRVPQEANIGVSAFTNQEVDDGMISCIRHGKSTLVSKQYYSLKKVCPDADFDCVFDLFLLYDVPKSIADAYYEDCIRIHPTNSEFTCLKDAYGFEEISYIVKDNFFVCVIKDGTSAGYLLLNGPSEPDFIIRDDIFDFMLNLFREGKNTYGQN